MVELPLKIYVYGVLPAVYTMCVPCPPRPESLTLQSLALPICLLDAGFQTSEGVLTL